MKKYYNILSAKDANTNTRASIRLKEAKKEWRATPEYKIVENLKRIEDRINKATDRCKFSCSVPFRSLLNCRVRDLKEILERSGYEVTTTDNFQFLISWGDISEKN